MGKFFNGTNSSGLFSGCRSCRMAEQSGFHPKNFLVAYQVIKRMWPFISDYARNIILQTVEPAISANLPAALKPFKFTTIDLGDTVRLGLFR